MADRDASTVKTSTENSYEDKRKKFPAFGVRSYLHHFYGSGSINKEGTIFEDPAEDSALLKPKKSNRKYCCPILWKAAIWIGINFLIFGVVGILVAYFVPKKIVYAFDDKSTHVTNKEAKVFNNNLEIVKFVGLLFFCIGGGLTIIGLLIPTLLWKHCFETRIYEPYNFGLDDDKGDTTKVPMSNFPDCISTKLDKVQPDQK